MIYKSDEATTLSDFPLSYIRDYSFADNFTIPAMLNGAGRKSHVPDCDMPDILHILQSLKITARGVSGK